MPAFYSSFSDVNDIFDGFEATTSFDPFSADQSDTDRTGVASDSDDLADVNPFEDDQNVTETFEDLDDDDVEIGEGLNEESINEVDLDFEDEIEPDWSPDDRTEGQWDATDSSEENETLDTDIDDNPNDQWDEVSQVEETSEWNDILQEDEISQLEETGYDEPLWFEEDDDTDPDLTDDAVEDILDIDHLNDNTDDIVEEIERQTEALLDSARWIDALEDFLDFTEQDISSFHDDLQQGFEITDGYDPPDSFQDTAINDMIELPNVVDDVFTDIFPDPINDEFSWFDSFAEF